MHIRATNDRSLIEVDLTLLEMSQGVYALDDLSARETWDTESWMEPASSAMNVLEDEARKLAKARAIVARYLAARGANWGGPIGYHALRHQPDVFVASIALQPLVSRKRKLVFDPQDFANRIFSCVDSIGQS